MFKDFPALGQLNLDSNNAARADGGVCLESQQCDKITCEYGLQRLLAGAKANSTTSQGVPADKTQIMLIDDSKKTEESPKKENAGGSDKGSKFSDELFPASSTSLYWEKFIGKTQKDTVENLKKVSLFTRIGDINKTGSLWGEHSQASRSLKQGLLTDCWVIGAAAAIQEASLERIFTQKKL